MPVLTEEEHQEDGAVEQLSTDPFLAAVHDGKSYGILKRIGDGGRLCCVMCSGRQKSCTHVSAYREWCKARDVDPDVVFTALNEPVFSAVSTSPVPYPFTTEMRESFESLFFQVQNKEKPGNILQRTPG
uniref:Uncharacterized protein n=1 Tax=Branchiostoma floridae TaxID=7739 RepID=C3Y463_BRAFL|eukprot:XP_002609079.1 hypothetical protein BRAFLDRAFT_91048 [Branchiostoma floridae]